MLTEKTKQKLEHNYTEPSLTMVKGAKYVKNNPQ